MLTKKKIGEKLYLNLGLIKWWKPAGSGRGFLPCLYSRPAGWCGFPERRKQPNKEGGAGTVSAEVSDTKLPRGGKYKPGQPAV